MTIREKVWETKSGLRAAVVITSIGGGRKGHRCGYVGVPHDHPLHGASYSEQIDCISRDTVQDAQVGKKGVMIVFTASVGSDGDDLVRRSPDILFDVHGGLTYSEDSSGDYPVESDELWWFGFDCCHGGDGRIEPDPDWPNCADSVVRSLEYVVAECESLAGQLVAFAKAVPEPAP